MKLCNFQRRGTRHGEILHRLYKTPMSELMLLCYADSVRKNRKGKREMDIFDVLTLIGGLCLFLFGMDLMGEALERRAGRKLRALIGKMTGKPVKGFLYFY